MKALRPNIIESSLLCLLLFAQGCSHNHPDITVESSKQKTIENHVRPTAPQERKTRQKMTIEEARKVLQDAEQVLAETKIAVEQAEKKHMTLEEMLVADVKAVTAYNSVKLIPANLVVPSNDMIERNRKLIPDLVSTRNKLNGIIGVDIHSNVNDISKKTGKTETKLRWSLGSMKKVIDRYPAPDLVNLKDTIAGKLESVKQVRSEPIEKELKRIQAGLKDVSHYLREAQEASKKKDFDASLKWRMRIRDNIIRLFEMNRSQYDAVLKIEGNTSALIELVLKTSNDVTVTWDHFNKEHDLSSKEEEDYIKTLSRDAKVAKAKEVMAEAEQDVLKAREHHKKDNTLEASISYGRSRLSLIRSRCYMEGLSTSELGESTVPNRGKFIGEADAYNSSYHLKNQEKRELFFRGVAKRLRTIEESIKEAEVLARRAEGVLKHYHPMRVAGLVKRDSRKKSDNPMVKVSRDGDVSSYHKGDNLEDGDRVGYSYVSYAELPRIDTGETFNGLSSRKRRVHDVSVRVINTSDLEVGKSFESMRYVKGLNRGAKTGEFKISLDGDFTTDDSLCFRQKIPSVGLITAFISHFKVGG